MNREFYLDLAKSGAAFPIGTDLIVHEKNDPKKVMLDGVLLGKVVEEASRRYNAPLAFPLMDLKLEKALLLDILGVSQDKVETYHFETCPTDEMIGKVKKELLSRSLPRIDATCGAVKYIADNTDLIPVGMCIGTFSLMTKLLSDPITAVYMLGMGIQPDEEETVGTVKKSLDLACMVVKRCITMQIEAGAKAIIMCEPAANKIYISPTQIEEGSDVFDRCVMDYAFEIKDLLNKHKVDLILHDCGELTDYMIERFVKLDPAMLSLGSSRKLWDDARIVPKSTVLYGNLPSKHFYSDEKITKAQVIEKSLELVRKMKEVGHPFILGSECDVLSVPESLGTINEKVSALVNCGCGCSCGHSHARKAA
ncbi:MAG: uroporphyrinogen decarboxylase family protein [Victivallales bacterium]